MLLRCNGAAPFSGRSRFSTSHRDLPNTSSRTRALRTPDAGSSFTPVLESGLIARRTVYRSDAWSEIELQRILQLLSPGYQPSKETLDLILGEASMTSVMRTTQAAAPPVAEVEHPTCSPEGTAGEGVRARRASVYTTQSTAPASSYVFRSGSLPETLQNRRAVRRRSVEGRGRHQLQEYGDQQFNPDASCEMIWKETCWRGAAEHEQSLSEVLGRGEPGGGARSRRRGSLGEAGATTMEALMAELKQRQMKLTRRQEEELVGLFQQGISIRATAQALEAKLGGAPTLQQLASELKRPIEEVWWHVRAAVASKDVLVRAHAGQVVALALRHQRWNQEIAQEDLAMEGLIGLERGLCKYNLGHGTKLSSFLHWWIRDAITKAAAAERDAIIIPKSQQENMNKVQKHLHRLRSEKRGREPSLKELSAAVGLSERVTANCLRVHAMRQTSFTALSQQMAGGGGGSVHEVEDVLEGLWSVRPSSMRELGLEQLLQLLLSSLPEREQRIVSNLYGMQGQDSADSAQLAREMQVTRSCVNRIKQRALAKLRLQAQELGLQHTLFQELQTA